MRFAKSALIVLLLNVLPNVVLAVGLGDVTLKSGLNQPLQAEVQLLEIGDLSDGELLVGLASLEDFERAGVERPFFLVDLKFSIDLENPSGPVVRVTSRKPVREPFLNFLLEVQWPSGRLLREYTLLMDLPIFSKSTKRQATAPAPSGPADPPVSQNSGPQDSGLENTDEEPSSVFSGPSQSSASDPATVSSDLGDPSGSASSTSDPDISNPSSISYDGDEYGPVAEDETLWEIALRVRPDRSQSVQQTMLAIQRINPDAFIDGNINRLKKGSVLRVPSSQDISGLSLERAIEVVAEQNTVLAGFDNNSSGSVDSSSGRSNNSDRQNTANVASSSERARLQLLAPGSGSAAGGKGAGVETGSVDALENELAITREQLDSSSRENSELRSKIRDLEGQIDTLEGLVSLSDDKLKAAELALARLREQQAKAANSDTTTDTNSTESNTTGSDSTVRESSDELSANAGLGNSTSSNTDTRSEPGVNTGQPSTEDGSSSRPALGGISNQGDNDSQPSNPRESSSTSNSSNTSSNSQNNQASAGQNPPPRVTQPPPPPPSSPIMDNLPLIGAGAAGLLVLGAGFFWWRSRSQDDDEYEFEDEEYEENLDDVDGDSELDEALADLDDEGVLDIENLDSSDDSLEEMEAESDDIADTMAEAESTDPIGESDIYMAYGRYDQAEALLNKAMDKEPNRSDLKLKMLEVIVESGEKDKFDPIYSDLLALGDSLANERAASLRANLSDMPYFDDGGLSGSSSAGADTGLNDIEFNLDAESGEDDSTVVAGSLDADASDDDFGIDLGNEMNLDGLDDDLESLDLVLDGDNSNPAEEELSLDEDASSSSELSFELDLDSQDTDTDSGSDILAGLDLDLDEEDDVGEINPDLSTESEDLGLEFDLGVDTDVSESSSKTSSDPDALQIDLGKTDSLSLGLEDYESDSSDSLEFSLEDDSSELSLDLDSEGLSEANEELPDLDLSLDSNSDQSEFSEDEFDLTALEKNDDFSTDDEVSLDMDFDSSGLDSGEVSSDILNDNGSFNNSNSSNEEMFDLSSLESLDSEPQTIEGSDDFTDDFDDDLDLDSGANTGDLDSLDSEFEENFDIDAISAEDDNLLSLDTETASSTTLQPSKTTSAELDADFGPDSDNFDPESGDFDEEFDFLADADEVATKLDLARAYIDMGDSEGAKDILDEVVQEGNEEQKQEANNLLAKV